MDLQTQQKRAIIQTLFKLDDKPLLLTDGQLNIIDSILDSRRKRIWISTTTQYGKSLTVALAAILLASKLHRKVLIIAPKEDQAKIIMRYVLEHVLDHPLMSIGLLQVSEVERLKTERSKNRLAWATGGEIMIGSADARNATGGTGLLGFGADVIIVDESALIPNENFEFILRMLGRHSDTKLVEISNPYHRNHFFDSSNDPSYYKVHVDYKQAIREGRLTQSFIDEMQRRLSRRMFKIMYEVLFPNENEYSYFKPQKYSILPKIVRYYGAIDLALGENKKACLTGIVVLGLDQKNAVYEVESIGEIMKPEDAMNTVLNLPYKFERFGVESVQFQMFFLKEIERKSKELKKYIPFEPIRQKHKKEARIETLEPPVNTGQLLFKGSNELWKEMMDYPDSAYVDVLDTLEMAWRLVADGAWCPIL